MITPQDAIIYTMVMVSGADRAMDDVELSHIGGLVKALPVFENYVADRLPDTARECAVVLQTTDGLNRCIALVVEALSPRQRETAYLLACEIAVIDRKVQIEEAGLLRLLRRKLQIDDLVAAALERATNTRLASCVAA